MKYNHVLWDFDGTLFDTYPAMSKAIRDVLLEEGIDESVEKIEAMAKISMGHVYKYLKDKYDVDDLIVEKYKRHENEELKKSILPFENIPEICKAIGENGGFNYLVTHRGSSAAYFLEKFGIKDYFKELITSESNFPRKPNPDSILHLVRKYNMNPEDAIMIGDRDIDIDAAVGAGIKSCYFNINGGIYGNATFNISGFSQLYDIIRIRL